jgi:hypothetical protein
MTYSEGRGPAYISPFRCSLCQTVIGHFISHTIEDMKEIYDLLKVKQTAMMCMSCSAKHNVKEGFEDTNRLA